MKRDNIIGGIFGVVVGDALGLPVQFATREKVKLNPVIEMRGYGTFTLPAGSWSDDSSMTLCLVESLCEAGYSPDDIAERFVLWYTEGYWTPFGQPFDIGRTTAEAMERLIDGIAPAKAGSAAERSNGNGSLMRILPAVLYFAELPDNDMLEKVCEISRITHGHPRTQLGCCLYALLVKEILCGKDPTEAYHTLAQKAVDTFANSALSTEIAHYERVINGTLPKLHVDQIKSSGYVVDTLEAAIWALLTSSSFRGALLTAVNLGDDADTVGAVAGGLAGSYYGVNDIPQDWLNKIIRYDEIGTLTERFADVVNKLSKA